MRDNINVRIIVNKGNYQKVQCPIDSSSLDTIFFHRKKHKAALLFQCGFVITLSNIYDVTEENIMHQLSKMNLTLKDHHICIARESCLTEFYERDLPVRKEVA